LLKIKIAFLLFYLSFYNTILFGREIDDKMNVYLKMEGQELLLDTVDNSSVTELKNRLLQSPIVLKVEDYGNMEKVGELENKLPINDELISVSLGDVTLYQGKFLAFYYDKNTWNLTKIGKIQGITKTKLKDLLSKTSFITLYLK